MNGKVRGDMGGGRERTLPADFPSNSKSRKAPSQQVRKTEKIVTGAVIQRKKGFGQRFKESLVGDKGVEGVVEDFVTDILVATAKAMISDTVGQIANVIKDGVDTFLFGETRRIRVREPGSAIINYNKIRGRQPEYTTMSPRARSQHDFGQLILATRAEAEGVLQGLHELISQYGVVGVSDLYDLVGITSDFPDNDWGWYNVDSASIRPVRGGYLISLPRTRPIK